MKFLRATAFFLLFSLLFSVSFQQAQDDDTVCSSNSDCEATEFCNKEFCHSKEGICSPRGEFCSEQIDPICGCDGKTYPNACKAMLAGVDLAKKGECQGAALVDTCSANEECGKGEFCFFENCEDTTGTCVSRGGDFCPADFDPVCGCDGKTYSNRCSAFNSGASINNRGACDADDDETPTPTAADDSDDDDDDDEDQKDKVCESTQDCASFQFCNKETCETRTGVCVNKTVNICPAVFDPVCGCNGKTYSSECDALTEGVLLKSKGACVKLTAKPIEEEEEEEDNGPDFPCNTNTDCDKGFFCNKEKCSDKNGICSPKGDFCSQVFAPVCGCDGKTYSSACVARQQGALVASSGACGKEDSEEEDFGTDFPCNANTDCEDGFFCNKEKCSDKNGICSPKGDFCSQVFAPVCGCDGKTYSSACVARQQGALVATSGACGKEDSEEEDFGTDFPCNTNTDCDKGFFCNKEKCSDKNGICSPKGDFCSQVFAPVCGCDGKTYSSACVARQQGALVASSGACGKEDSEEEDFGTDFPCNANTDCEDGFFCNKEKCSDKNGICAPKGDFCSQVFAPVCGCDGKTYSSACVARQQGALVASSGACRKETGPFIVLPPAGVFCSSATDCASGHYCQTTSCKTTAGICTKRPEMCTAAFSPVCDCSGKTHPSQCHAAQTGANIMHAGQCKAEEKQAACSSNADCDEDDYCKKEACGIAKGMCVDRGFAALCAMDFKPVCGCDGRTHSNPCRAAQAGVNIAYDGECGKASPTPVDDDDDDDDTPTPTAAVQPPAPKPTAADDSDDDDDDEESPSPSKPTNLICADDAECPAADDFCYKDSCNAPQGVCTKNADTVCFQVLEPVCGCDGKTYGSACKALAAGVNVDRQGSCDNGDNECDGNEDCKRAEYCAKESCSAAKGKCSLAPEFCTQVVAPVCGCDGKTHNSACHASALGVNVKHSGICNNTASSTQCFGDEQCQKGLRCARSTCDGAGVCQPKTSARFCLALYKPVCGCDGKTYSNSCQANIAGANIAFSGECKRNRKLKRRK